MYLQIDLSKDGWLSKGYAMMNRVLRRKLSDFPNAESKSHMYSNYGEVDVYE